MFDPGDLFNIGIPEIDKEHEAIFGLCREIHNELLRDGPRKSIVQAIKKLTATAESHFDNEERIFAAAGLAGPDRHRKEHKRLLETLAAIMKKVETGSRSWRRDLIGFTDVMQRHIITFDFELKEMAGPPADK